MMRYMVESTLKHAHTPETIALIPAETARGQELDALGVRLSLFVAADYSRAWQVYVGESQGEVEQALATLPLHPFLNHLITPLAEQL
jgi:muconolactone delta-isomerase